jgi:drug/metabolite transporter (DMT)-like permease
MNFIQNLVQIIKKSSVLMIIIGAVMISFSGVYVKLAHVSPTVSGFYRMFFGGICLTLIVILKKEKIWDGLKIFILSLICGLFIALDLYVWHKSVLYIGPGLSTILANFQVFFLAIIGVIFLGEKKSIKLFVSIPMAIVGLFLIVGIKWGILDHDYKIGVILGLVTALFYTSYLMSLRSVQTNKNPLSPYVNLSVISIAAAIILLIISLSAGESLLIPDTQSYLSLLAYGIFSQVIGWILISKGMPNIDISIVGLILLLQPTLAFIWDILFFQHQTTLISILGVIITITAIYLGSTRKR